MLALLASQCICMRAKPTCLCHVHCFQAPDNADDREAWLKQLVKPLYNGCGHIRLMLVDKTSGYYSVKVGSAPLTDCGKTIDTSKCIAADKVAARIIEKYFR